MPSTLLVYQPNRPFLTDIIRETDEQILLADELLDGTLLGATSGLDSTRLQSELEECRRTPGMTRFHEEAMLTRTVATLIRAGDLDDARRVYTEARHLGLGLNVRNPLAFAREAALRGDAKKRVQLGYRALVWGLQNEDKGIYETLAAVVRLLPHEVYPFTAFRTRDFKLQVVRELLAASGVTHAKTLDAAEKLTRKIMDADLNRLRPNGEDYTALDPSELARAKFLTEQMQPPGKKADAYNLFQILSRIAAYNIGGLVRFRSSWMKGASVNAAAIPGVSTKADEYVRVLTEHVLELVQGHSGGRKSRTYRLKVELQRGLIQRNEAATRLGVELNPKGGPKKVTRNWDPIE